MISSGKNSTYLRASNKKVILDLIRTNRVSRAQLARMTGLTRPSISSIVDDLIKTGFVIESGVEEIDRGRHPEILALRPKAYYAVGVDISRDKCTFGVMDMTGEIIAHTVKEVDQLTPVMAVIRISSEIKSMLLENGIDLKQVLGVGVSVPGPLDTITGTIINPPYFEKWHNFNVVEQFQKELGLPVYAENHATAYGLAERLFGQGTTINNYFMLVLTDGVGSAEILNGKPYRGLRGLNSEFGHVSIDINGKLCRCGNRGCLELYTSIPAVIEKANQSGIDVKSWEDIVDAALSGDQQCLEIIEEEAKYLSFAVLNIMNVFIPQAIILSGRIQYKPDLLLNRIQNDVFARDFTKNICVPQILMSKLNENSEIIAASSIVLNSLFASSEDD